METQKMFIAGEIGYNWGNYEKVSLFYQDPKPLDVFIDSAGGSVSDAHSFSALLRMRAAQGVEVRTIGLGRVASAAVGILLSGTRVEMDIMCNLLIHPITVDWFSGNATEMRQTADAMEMMTNDLINMYVRKIEKSGKATDKTRKQVEEMMTKQTWLSAQQALDLGFIDAIQTFETEKEEAESIIKTMPTKQLAQYQNFINKLNPENMATDKEILTALEENQKGFFAKMTDFFSNIFVKPTTPAVPEVVAPAAPIAEVVTPVINNEAVTLKAQLEAQAQKMKELEMKNAELQTKAPIVQNGDVPEESNEPNNKAMQKLKGFQAFVKSSCPTLHNAIKTTYGK